MTVSEAVEDVLFAHFWTPLTESCICGWSPNGPRRTQRRKHAEHVTQRLADAGLIVTEKAS